MSGKRAPKRSSFGPDQRVAAHQVDVIGDQHQRALGEAGVDAAGGVGQDQHLHAEQAEHARGERRDAPSRGPRRRGRGPTAPARAGRSMRAGDQLAGVADDLRRRPVRDDRVRHDGRVAQRAGEGAEARAEHHGDVRHVADRVPGRSGRLRRRRRSGPGSQQRSRNRRGDEVGERAGDHRADAEPRQIVPARRRQRADAAELDADRREVGEAAQREGGDGERARIERRP